MSTTPHFRDEEPTVGEESETRRQVQAIVGAILAALTPISDPGASEGTRLDLTFQTSEWARTNHYQLSRSLRFP